MKTQEKRLNVRMSVRDYASLQIRAARKGQTISNYVRDLIKRDAANPIQADGHPAVLEDNI